MKFKYLACVTVFAVASVNSAFAEPVNYEKITRERILQCLHPTTDPKKATVEVVKTSTSNQGEETRVKVFYEGLVRKNALEMDVMIRRAGNISQLQVKVLADSSPSLSSCPMTKYWIDLPSE